MFQMDICLKAPGTFLFHVAQRLELIEYTYVDVAQKCANTNSRPPSLKHAHTLTEAARAALSPDDMLDLFRPSGSLGSNELRRGRTKHQLVLWVSEQRTVDTEHGPPQLLYCPTVENRKIKTMWFDSAEVHSKSPGSVTELKSACWSLQSDVCSRQMCLCMSTPRCAQHTLFIRQFLVKQHKHHSRSFLYVSKL